MSVVKIIKELYHNLTGKEWNIGFILKSPEEILQSDKLDVHWVKHKYKDRWFADPFILSVTEIDIVLLVEEKYHPINRGRISKLIVDRKTMCLKECVPVLELDTHLSFPAIFREGKSIYIYPENSEASHLKMYRYREDTNTVTLECLLSHKPLTDAVITTCFDSPCLLATNFPEPNGSVLGVYGAEEWNGVYELKYKVFFSDNTARSAGKIFKADNHFIRPAQDCNRSYGRGIVLQKVGFDNGKLTFQELKRFYPVSWRYPLGLHTLNVEGNVAVVDGLGFRKPVVGYILSRFRKIMRFSK